MPESTDMRITGVTVYFLPVTMRTPLKFGEVTVTAVTCARVCVTVADGTGRAAQGWGETPLSVGWGWPSTLAYDEREKAIRDFCLRLADAWIKQTGVGHPIEVGYDFQTDVLPDLVRTFNAGRPDADPLPHLAALIALSAFDIATHDAFGVLHDRPVYQTYSREFMNRNLAAFLEPEPDAHVQFTDLYPDAFLATNRPDRLRAWHLVGGLDPLEPGDATGNEPTDGYPVYLNDWIRTDGLKCLKIKLRGNDPDWDYKRIIRVGRIAIEHGVHWLSTDFNCTVTDPEVVNRLLDRLRDEHPRIYGMILYVEQPFPYDLDAFQVDVHSVSARKPLFMDESAHDWRYVRMGRRLGWNGVALKTCKTQTGALLSLCWAKAHGMPVMVQDLTNPMLAMIPHASLAAHAGTIMGVESNAMQFYPEASHPEETVHPGLYKRRGGQLDLVTLQGPGFGYRLKLIRRELPAPAIELTT